MQPPHFAVTARAVVHVLTVVVSALSETVAMADSLCLHVVSVQADGSELLIQDMLWATLCHAVQQHMCCTIMTISSSRCHYAACDVCYSIAVLLHVYCPRLAPSPFSVCCREVCVGCVMAGGG